MFQSRNEYDRGVNTFSPEGRLFQVEYALGAVKLGATAIGIRAKNCVILATEKRVTSALMEMSEDLQKIVEIDEHILCASAGIIADARTLIDHARVEAQQHHFTYNERMPVRSCVLSISNLALDFSGVNPKKKKVMSRPFGVSLLVAGIDRKAGLKGSEADAATAPALWVTDPSGTNVAMKCAAIGSAHEAATQLLQDHFEENLSLEDAQKLALLVLRQVMEDKMTPANVELAYIEDSKPCCHCTSEQIAAIVDKLPPPQEWERMAH